MPLPNSGTDAQTCGQTVVLAPHPHIPHCLPFPPGLENGCAWPGSWEIPIPLCTWDHTCSANSGRPQPCFGPQFPFLHSGWGKGMYRRGQVVSKALPLQFQVCDVLHCFRQKRLLRGNLPQSVSSGHGGGAGGGMGWSLTCSATTPEWTEPCPAAGSWAVPAPLASVTLLAQRGLDRMVSPAL